MTDSWRRDGSEPTQPLDGGYPVDYPDPAYANQPPYPGIPNYGPNPTQQLPSYPAYGYDPNASAQYGSGYQPPGNTPEPEPDDDGPRPWLWALAGLAVLFVVGLVISLVIADGSQQETVVAPQPVTPAPGSSMTTTAPPTTSRSPRPVPAPPASTSPTEPTTSGATETVTYEVAGAGRAINITYVDCGNMLQTEFNVMLPWSKQVELPKPATRTASITVVNFGPEVSCTVTVNGVQTQHRTGTGLTVCVGEGGPR